jgi:hypothetical protein
MKYDNLKLLKSGETGFGMMIENDAGYLSTDLNPMILGEGVKVKPNEPILINCILQKWGVKNKNGRTYPKEILVPQVNEYQKMVAVNSAVSEADHPDSSIISLQNLSHMITKMWWGTGDQENILFGELKLIVTRGYIELGIVSVIGDKILLYLENKIKLGISSRGVGTLKEIHGENMVQNDFELIGFDLVLTPSTPGAYLFPVANGNINSFGQSNEEYKKNNNGIYLNENNKIISGIDNFLFS